MVLDIFGMLTDPDEPISRAGVGYELVYRYTSRDGLLKYLIPSGQLRMNAWSLMNDPRETKAWQITGSWRTANSLARSAVIERVDQLLRRGARLLCASRDRDPATAASRVHLFHRGWAKAPMWQHYAEAHAGVCLVLDLGALNFNLNAVSCSGSRRWHGIGSVEYRDTPARVELSGNLATLADVDIAVEHHLDRRGTVTALHLQKTTEWQYEHEARLLAVDFDLPPTDFDKPLDGLPLGDALKAVVVGEAHVNPRATASAVRSSLGAGIEVLQCDWTGGVPRLHRI